MISCCGKKLHAVNKSARKWMICGDVCVLVPNVATWNKRKQEDLHKQRTVTEVCKSLSDHRCVCIIYASSNGCCRGWRKIHTFDESPLWSPLGVNAAFKCNFSRWFKTELLWEEIHEELCQLPTLPAWMGPLLPELIFTGYYRRSTIGWDFSWQRGSMCRQQELHPDINHS